MRPCRHVGPAALDLRPRAAYVGRAVPDVGRGAPDVGGAIPYIGRGAADLYPDIPAPAHPEFAPQSIQADRSRPDLLSAPLAA